MTPHKPPSAEWVGPAVTLIVLLSGLFVILNPTYDAATRTWATGIVGTIVGHWHGVRSRTRQ